MSPTCSNCQYWTGAPDSIAAICKLPRPGNGFTVTGADVVCSKHNFSLAGADEIKHKRPIGQKDEMENGKEIRNCRAGTPTG